MVFDGLLSNNVVDPKPKVSIAHLNGLRLPAHAEYFLRVDNEQQLFEGIVWATSRDLPVTVVGEGSNTVAHPFVRGLVIQIATLGLKLLHDDGCKLTVRAAAGENWHVFVSWTIEQGLYGLENLALIPGTVGAAPVQNIGAYGVEVASRIRGLRVCDLTNGEVSNLSPQDCQFAYRDSRFKSTDGKRFIILSVDFMLDRSAESILNYPELARALVDTTPTPSNVFDAVVALRRSKLPDPEILPNVGSFFKNPSVSSEQAQHVGREWPEMPQYPTASDRVKLSAGWMIDQLGWREATGQTGIGIYSQHALVMVNHDCGHTEDVLSLAAAIVASVEAEFAITLEMEPSIIGNPTD